MRNTIAAALAGLLLATPAAAMQIASSDIATGATIAPLHIYKDCKGKNVSPALSWSGVPKDAKSLAVTLFDPDAGGGFWHWMVLDIAPSATGIPQGAGGAKGKGLPAGALQGANSMGVAEYSGPCPPAGDKSHHYQFILWALDVPSVDPVYTDSAMHFEAFLHRHAIDKAVLVGMYGR